MENEKMKVSIIVPVYNSEKTLNRCLNSIINQTYPNLEILLINDGSTDSSSKICENYAATDTRIKYFSRENQGVSAVREFGLSQATGEYLIHFDSDDWAEPEMIADMADEAIKQNADLLICDFYVDTPKGVIYSRQRPTSLQPLQVLHEILSGTLHGSTWNKLVRTELFFMKNIHFPMDVNYCEDVIMWVDFLQNDVNVAYLPIAYYHYDYNTNTDSITRNYTRKTLEQRKSFITILEHKLDNNEFKFDIVINKLNVKFEVFEKRLISNIEFCSLYPEVNTYIFKMKTSLLNRVLLFFASIGQMKMFSTLYKIKNKRGR